MKVTVLFFARSRELAGRSEDQIELGEGSGTLQLLDTLLEQVRPGPRIGLITCCARDSANASGHARPSRMPSTHTHTPQIPALNDLGGRFVFSLNQEYLQKDQDVVLKNGDEVAIIPPISGG